MPESQTTKHRRDLLVVVLALFCSATLAAFVAVGSFFWNELEQARGDNSALADQVRSLGGKPVAEGKPGARGDQGPPGPQGQQGQQGTQGPPGIQGKPGPIGITGQSPACLLEPSRCVGPKGSAGQDGTDGSQGEPGATGKTGDQGIPGVAGKDGVDGEPGAPGKDGADGKDGRGIADADCQDDGTWLITYTDGSTDTKRGPCRVVVVPTPEAKSGS